MREWTSPVDGQIPALTPLSHSTLKNMELTSARKTLALERKNFSYRLFFIFSLDFTMSNAELTGQKHMWINDFDLRLAGLIITLDLSFARLQIAGDHRTTGSILNGIITVPISGQGRVNMDVNNIHVTGTGQLVTIPGGFLHLNQFFSTTDVESVNAALTGFGFLDGLVSQTVSSIAPEMVNNSQDTINDAVGAVLLPGINRFLNNHTLTTLVNIMADRNQNPPPRRCFW